MESSPARVAPQAILDEPLVVPPRGNGSTPAPDSVPAMPAFALPRLTMPAFTLPKVSMPVIARLSVASIAWPRLHLPTFVVPGLRPPRVSRLVLVVAAVLAVLLIAPLAYVLLPSIRPVAARQAHQGQPAPKVGTPASNSARAVAIVGVKAKTGLAYGGGCATTGPCLTVAGETLGQDAAAVLFATAGSGGRQCVGYAYRTAGGWRFLDAVCGLPGQLAPLVGHDAAVHVPGSCANVRNQASLSGRIVGCVYDGTTVHIDGGPTYADGRFWWHEPNGWIAHDFLTGP